VFDTPSSFIDPGTRDALRAHRDMVEALRRKRDIDWPLFIEKRRWLLALNEEVGSLVAMREVPVRGLIEQRLDEQVSA
jgi:hypothetical protein